MVKAGWVELSRNRRILFIFLSSMFGLVQMILYNELDSLLCHRCKGCCYLMLSCLCMKHLVEVVTIYGLLTLGHGKNSTVS